jgi:hypothetical protein
VPVAIRMCFEGDHGIAFPFCFPLEQ